MIDTDPEGYIRRTLYNLAVDGWRRRTAWRARLRLVAAPDTTSDGVTAVDDRDRIVRLLRQLPPRQRAAIAFRYWEDLSEAETAKAMGCSVGTVKATTSKALQRLRELSTPADGPAPAAPIRTLTPNPAGSPS